MKTIVPNTEISGIVNRFYAIWLIKAFSSKQVFSYDGG